MEIILTTPRLILRRFTLADAGLLLQLNSDPEVLKYLHEPMLQDEAHAREILTNIILPQYNNNLGRWAVLLKDNNEFIGWCGLWQLKETGEIEVGYALFKEFWGRGFAVEASEPFLEYGFTELNLPKIVACANPNNSGSRRVMEKLGMTFDHIGFYYGRDLVHYTIWKEDFLTQRRKDAKVI
mgnify:CR=1 FL=1